MHFSRDTVITVRVKTAPVKTVQVITVLGKNGPAYNQPTNEQFCCLLKILESN